MTENVSERVGDDASESWSVRVPLHGERLSSPSLAISEDGPIVALQNVLHNRSGGLIVNFHLEMGWRKLAVKCTMTCDGYEYLGCVRAKNGIKSEGSVHLIESVGAAAGTFLHLPAANGDGIVDGINPDDILVPGTLLCRVERSDSNHDLHVLRPGAGLIRHSRLGTCECKSNYLFSWERQTRRAPQSIKSHQKTHRPGYGYSRPGLMQTTINQ